MTGWIIFLCIVALVALLLFFSVTVHIWYHNGHHRILVRYLFFTLYRDPPKNQSQKKTLRKAKKATRKAEKSIKIPADSNKQENIKKDAPKQEDKAKNAPKQDDAPKKEKTKLKIDWEEIFGWIETAGPPVKRLFSKIRVTGVIVDITVANEDAATTAMLYGTHQYLIHKMLGILHSFFRLSTKKVILNADFNQTKCKYRLRGSIRLRLGTALVCGIWFIIRYLKQNQSKTQHIPKTERNAHV